MDIIKCVNGHPQAVVDEQHKFCASCGGGVEKSTPGVDMVKCVSDACGVDIVKSAKFCHECGTPAADAAAELDTSLEELAAFAKARHGLEDDLFTVPELDDAATETAIAPAMAIVKAAVTQQDDGTGTGKFVPVLDAEMVVSEMVKSVTLMGAEGKAHTGKVLNALRTMGEIDATERKLLIKSTLAVGRAVQQLAARVTELGDQPRTPGGKALGTRVPVAGAPAAPAADTRTDIHGQDLLVKCMVVSDPEKGALNSTEIGVIEGYANMGYGIPEIMAERPALAHRVQRVLEIATH